MTTFEFLLNYKKNTYPCLSSGSEASTRSLGGAMGPRFKCSPFELPEPPLPLSKFNDNFSLCLFPENIFVFIKRT